MSELTLQLPEDVLTRLQTAAPRQQKPLGDLVHEAIENYLGGDDEPTKEGLLDDLRLSLLNAFEGRTHPADEVLDR
jgi:hypothetical protein